MCTTSVGLPLKMSRHTRNKNLIIQNNSKKILTQLKKMVPGENGRPCESKCPDRPLASMITLSHGENLGGDGVHSNSLNVAGTP